MKVRPASVTVIAWILIAIGVLSLFISTLFLINPDTRAWMTRNPHVFPAVMYFMLPYPYAGPLTTIVCGIGMLKGQNWARLLYVGWWGYAAYLVSIGRPPSMRLEMISEIGAFLIVVVLLFRPKANQYFRATEPANGSQEVYPTPSDSTNPLESSSQPSDLHPTSQDKSAVRKQPTSLTVIACYSILTGAIGLVSIISFFMQSLDPSLPEPGESVARDPLSILWGLLSFAGQLAIIFSGIGMLKGQNWARLLYIVGSVVVFLVLVTASPIGLEIIVPNLVIFLVVVVFLYRPKANRYFLETEFPTGSQKTCPAPLASANLPNLLSQPSPANAIPDKDTLRGRALVNASLTLAILMEVLPLEADSIDMALMIKSLGLFLIGKTICLAVILVPLVCYLWMNGWRGVSAAKGKIAAISIIVVLKLTMEVWYILHW